jgi:hypothetical protein
VSLGVVRLEGADVPFRLVRVRRRRSLLIRVTPDGAVEVRGPPKCTVAQAHEALHRHAGWLARTLPRVREAAESRPRLADGAALAVLGEPLTLRLTDGPRTVVRRAGAELQLTLPDPGESAVRGALERWLRREAQRQLPARLAALAAPLGVTPARVVVRGQRTRWGSCSSRGTVSLNWRLLLLPSALVDYVLLHEACHLRHLSHSPAFWALVATQMPDWAARRARLRALQGTLPL